MNITLSFLGLAVSALVFRNPTTGRWEIDDLSVTNDDHDMFNVLTDETLLEIEERVIDAALKQDYKWL